MNKLSALALVLALAAPASIAQATTTKAMETHSAKDSTHMKKHHNMKHGKNHTKKHDAMETPTESNSEIKPEASMEESK